MITLLQYLNNDAIAENILIRADQDTGEAITIIETNVWYDGTPIEESKCDGYVYFKKEGKYFRRTLDPQYSINIGTVDELRSFNAYFESQEITLLGYYQSGDKSPLNYKFTVVDFNSHVDDGGYKIKTDKGTWIAQFNGSVDILDFGAVGDFMADDTLAIQRAVDIGAKNTYFGHSSGKSFRISSTINIPYGQGRKYDGLGNLISFGYGVDGSVFTGIGSPSNPSQRIWNIDFTRFNLSNAKEYQTFLDLTSAHHIHVSNCQTDGTNLFIKARDCYFMTVEKNMLFGIYKAWDFRNGVNSFNIIGNSVYGEGVAAYFEQNTTGGNISGNSFELASGALEFGFGNFGINITGNYFEGYSTRDNYIKLEGGTYKAVQGFSISGNLFYTGANRSIELNNVAGISITGNNFKTKHAVRIYCFDNIRNENVDYAGNSYQSEEPGSSEFLFYGAEKDGIISRDYTMPQNYKSVQNSNMQPIGTDLLFFNNNKWFNFKDADNKTYVFSSSTVLYSGHTLQN